MKSLTPSKQAHETLSGTKAGIEDDDMRILVADDSAGVRRGVRDILASDRNHEVCGEAKDGPDAIQKAKELKPDLVLLDISMPGLNGLEVARRLRGEIPGTAIVIISQHDSSLLLPSAREAGAQSCVDKSRLGTDLLPTIASLRNSPEIHPTTHDQRRNCGLSNSF